MKLHLLGDKKTSGYGVFGCMWRQGECTADTEYVCRTAAVEGGGKEVPLQSRVTAYWPDGSVKWTAHVADTGLTGREIEVLPGRPQAKGGMTCTESEEEILVQAGKISVFVKKDGRHLFNVAERDGRPYLREGQAVLTLEEPFAIHGNKARMEKNYIGRIERVSVEETGSLRTILRYEGIHEAVRGQSAGDNELVSKLPFIIRMEVCYDSPVLKFTHTFLYDGDEDRDFLKGLGIRFTVPMEGALYNRHVKFTGDHGVFHETLVPLTSWRPRVPVEIYRRQMGEEKLVLSGEERVPVDKMLQDVPFWSEYVLCQDSASHFVIKKKLAGEELCYIDSLHGNRNAGGGAFGSEYGSVTVAVRDFWEKYPSGLEFKGLEADSAECTLWFWSPDAGTMDFRHYARRGYNQVCYEGYDYKGATADGIACTNECAVCFSDKMIPTDGELEEFAGLVNDPAVYVGTPEFYHEMRAFGYWSLPMGDAGRVHTEKNVEGQRTGKTAEERNMAAAPAGRIPEEAAAGGVSEVEGWLEEQLEKAFTFYQREIDQRNWYGMFNYGDVMHTYDSLRHQWKYDIGGYAWDNTELVPTLWLWLYFMRTGREDVYRMAERLSRHASEVDVYHMGKYKGLGSRHNVRHWGCPCKEARIAMAGHHRYLYYLTGDRRLEDIFEELKDNEMSFLNKDPLGDFYDKKDMVYPTHARSGPDWSSLCSNWMTRWERFNDARYLGKIRTGIEDIKKTPMKLVSGPDFEFDPATCHLRYIGERTTGGTHLQICMGAPQIWMELGELLEDQEWREMLVELGRIYFMTKEERQEATGGLTGKREFTYPIMAAGLGAYAAAALEDEELASRVWKVVLGAVMGGEGQNGFEWVSAKDRGNQKTLREIPWVSTNFTSQFCLNVIMCLDFIRQWLPVTMEEAGRLVGKSGEYLHKA